MTRLRGKGGAVRLVSFDPRLSATAGRSDEWLPLLPGTDSVVALAMAKVIMDEGLYDKAFIEKWTDIKLPELKARLAEFTPANAERLSGVKAGDIRRIAAEYAKADRAVLLTGGGVSKHEHGTANERAVRLLSVITGKVDRLGCNMIPRTGDVGRGGPEVAVSTPDALYKKLVENPGHIGVYIAHCSDPVYASPASDQMAKVFADESLIPFVVSLDTHVTDTGRYADMVLPVATFLEEYGVESSPGPGGGQIIGLRQPVVQPLGESRPYIDVLAQVAARAGATLSSADAEEYTEKMAKCSDGFIKGGMDMLAGKGFFSCSIGGAHDRPYITGGFNTRTKKVVAAGQGLPGFSQPEVYKGLGPKEFVLVRYSPAAYREGVTENNLLLREIFHENRLYVNSAAGKEMGLKSWEKVRIQNDLGRLEVTVVLSPGVHPKTVALASGCGHEGYGHIEKAEKFDSSDPFTKVIWWHKDGSGVNPNRITPFSVDAHSGGQGWMLTKITVEKA